MKGLSLSFKTVSLADLSSVAYNPRKISKKRMERLIASIREHTKALSNWKEKDGFRLASTVTINVQGKRIVGGHQRVSALKKLGQEWIHAEDITWIDLKPDSPEEKALNISLNDDQASGSWDNKKRTEVLGSILENMEDLYKSLDFSSLTKKLKDAGESDEAKKTLAEAKEKKIQFVDNVSFAVQEILNKYGETVPYGFMLFCFKNRVHLIVQCDEETHRLSSAVAEGLKRENRTINEFLTKAFRLGMEDESWKDLMEKAESEGMQPVSPEEVEGEDDYEPDPAGGKA